MTAIAATPGSGRDVSAALAFVRACAAEWTRLWTVRATWGFLSAAAVAMVGFGAAAGGEGAAGDPAWAVAGFTAMPAQFILISLALVAITSDYATGGIVPTLQWTPRRIILFLARSVVAIGTATLLGAMLVIASAVTAYAAAWPNLTLPLDTGLDRIATVAFVFACGTALGVGLGFLLRNTAGALVAVFLLMLVLPLALPAFGLEWMTALAGMLPGAGAEFLLFGERPGMTQPEAVTVMLAWGGGALLLGGLRVMLQDANR